MTETVKRLEPTKDTLRELFLKSGNECAYPGCTHKIISSSGVFLSQICHIEAANEGGERFNPNQTNEQRRSFDNLLLMCHAHHKITDDVNAYPVERMKDIKSQHESKFTDIVSTIQNSFTDHTEHSKVQGPSSLDRINRVLSWNNTSDELVETLEDISVFSKRLLTLPMQARQILTLMVKRSAYDHINRLHISEHEINLATGADISELRKVIQVLDKYGFIQEGFPDDFNLPVIEICEIERGWPFLKDLKEFCEAEDIALDEVLVDLNFALLD
ncbi:hypothetical protein [Marinospirillum perlucidum]|uniref:hypothetical protein n=1 Tax=Marinospirillum perlucidum TaxID=1982602 RepID=UPI000DF4940A|nr:hypothetical protein [Marinospirillum perlucidum]